MDHKIVLDKLLANSCPRGEDENGNTIFMFDLHCMLATVVAELVSTLDSIQYKIISVDLEIN